MEKLEEEKSNELLKKIIKNAEKLDKNIDRIINELAILRKLKKKEN